MVLAVVISEWFPGKSQQLATPVGGECISRTALRQGPILRALLTSEPCPHLTHDNVSLCQCNGKSSELGARQNWLESQLCTDALSGLAEFYCSLASGEGH